LLLHLFLLSDTFTFSFAKAIRSPAEIRLI
jgi:hypothetical protein